MSLKIIRRASIDEALTKDHSLVCKNHFNHPKQRISIILNMIFAACFDYLYVQIGQ